MKNPTQKSTPHKLFESSTFKICFFIFIFLLILDCYQIVFASIESVFFILDIDNYAYKIGKIAVLNGYEPFIYTSFYFF
ncbi:MAG: hypothetical protein MR902_03980 [Campylobacter sp.]|nr:hypothetical protein [Campylobacter sp.]